ncbi:MULTISPECIES: GNAT family N-acetyltransferase [unclassified Kribbella]|uniref:GNAT family N-acetyltransferase n=1 Tax=unclassified Kribbella TaxID=2644121 RepID=UPI00301B1489
MELRGFADEHARQVAGWASTAQEVGLLCGRVEYPFPEELTGSWRKVDPDIQSYLFFDGESPVGYGELWLDDDEDEVELARLIVDPAVRGRGIGAGLVRALLKPAIEAGHPDIFLRVRPDNAVAIKTYLSAGFVDVSQQEMDEWNAGQPLAYRWMRYRSS